MATKYCIIFTISSICAGFHISHDKSNDFFKRFKRQNPFNPSPPMYPTANMPFFVQPPFPIPTTTMSPAEALMPKEQTKFFDKTDNPWVEEIQEPINPNYGNGFLYVQPTVLSSNFDFPTWNPMRPQESVSGTLAVAQPFNQRMGMRGGPTFPWQSKSYAKNYNGVNAMRISGQQQQFSSIDSNNQNINSVNPALSMQQNSQSLSTNRNSPVAFPAFKPELPPLPNARS